MNEPGTGGPGGNKGVVPVWKPGEERGIIGVLFECPSAESNRRGGHAPRGASAWVGVRVGRGLSAVDCRCYTLSGIFVGRKFSVDVQFCALLQALAGSVEMFACVAPP